MLLPIHIMPSLFMGVPSSRDQLTRVTTSMAETYFRGNTGSKRYKQQVDYYQWKLQKKYEKTFGYKLWAFANDCFGAYIRFWQAMYVLRCLSMMSGHD